ncbi:MAG: (2Fe-2S)-binding protein [Flavobacteriaceae bacterium]
MKSVSFTVNNKRVEIQVDSDMPLLWALRDLLNYTGTKFGCGKGLCGACMVLLDNQAVNSCQLKAVDADGATITTIEGKDEVLQSLQQSWEVYNVPQCGFCQPGQLITATALLKNNSQPSDSEIDAQMQRNICRCGTYERIKTAIKNA